VFDLAKPWRFPGPCDAASAKRQAASRNPAVGSLKPECGAPKALGRLPLEASAAVTFFTTNDDFLDGKTLEQEPLYSVQGHLVYEFGGDLWASLDTAYYTGGSTIVDGEEDGSQENARLALTISFPVSRYNSVKLFGSTGLYSRTGSDFDSLGIAWQFAGAVGFDEEGRRRCTAIAQGLTKEHLPKARRGQRSSTHAAVS